MYIEMHIKKDQGKEVFLGNTPNLQYFFTFYHFNVLEIPYDEIDSTVPQVKTWFKDIIFDGESHEIITVLEQILRFKMILEWLKKRIKECFQFAPYFIDESSEPVCIVPTTSEEMEESASRSLPQHQPVRINWSEVSLPQCCKRIE